MKILKQYRVFMIILCAHSMLFAQSEWTQLNTGSNHGLLDLCFPTNQVGYASGRNGTIIKTTDAGASWTSLNSGTSLDIKSIDFINENIGFADIQFEGLLRTTDGGVTWNQVQIPGLSSTNSVQVHDQIVFVSGWGKLLKSIDGGVTWTQSTVINPTSSSSIENMSFPSTNVGYATRRGYSWSYLKTIDGGDTWTETEINSPINNWTAFLGIHFTSETTGFLCGEYIADFVQTTDGGITWEKVNDLDSGVAVNFFDVNYGYSSSFGDIFETTDGGVHWNIIDGISGTDITFDDQGTAYIVSGFSIFKLKTTLSTSDFDTVDKTSVYPNPSPGNFTINMQDTEAKTLIVLDMQGRIVYKSHIEPTPQTNIDLTHMSNGIYQLMLVSDKEVETIKLIKSSQ